jgi:tetratricopeptide (TPR) repeat protein
MDPDDIFMDRKRAPYEKADPYDDEADEFRSDFAFEEDDDEGSFFMRHLRGIVGLALFVILLLMFVIFAFSRAGQQSLARVNLAWSTEAYSQLGYESYQAQQFEQAGLYYERALQRDPDNYSYASSAAMAYNEAGNREKAAQMLKECARINPTLLEPYIYLLNLYPDAADRPWDVTQLLQQGYKNTGDTRLNVTG